MQNMNIRNQQLYQESSESKKELELKIQNLQLAAKESTSSSNQNPSNDAHIVKLADFSIFLMKLMQRLESQTHSNISDNPKFESKINDQKYI